MSDSTPAPRANDAEKPDATDGSMGADAPTGDAGLVEDPDISAPEGGTQP